MSTTVPSTATAQKRKREEPTSETTESGGPQTAAPATDTSTQPEKRIKLEPTDPPLPSASNTLASASAAASTTTKKKRRWDTNENAPAATTTTDSPTTNTTSTLLAPSTAPALTTASEVQTAAEKAAALKKSVADRLAALKKVPKLTAQSTPGAAVNAAATAIKLESSTGTASSAQPSAANSFQFMTPSVVVVKDEPKGWLPTPLRLDALGRELDANGQVIPIQRPSELKVNQRADAAAHAQPKEKLAHAKISTTIYKQEGQSKFFDPRMRESGPMERKPRAPIEFVKPGKYIAQAAQLRMKQLEKDMAITPINSIKSDLTHSAITILKPGPIPAVEWWDIKLLKDPSAYPDPTTYSDTINFDRITSYVYHPVEVMSLTAAPPPPPMAVLLTKKERLKIKKRDKRDKLKDERDRVRLGIEAPKEPKMRLQNLMNVLLNDTVADPSMMEAKVRAQMAQRVEGHLEANASRKLTAEQKAEKRRKKYLEDTSHEVHVSVYRAGELSDGKTRYQIDINTQQWNLTGVGVIHPDCSVIIVEGGPKNQRRFKRLMLHRIKWRRKKKGAMERAEANQAAGGGDGDHTMDDGEEANEEDESEDESDDESDAEFDSNDTATTSKTGACALIWSGIIPKTRFPTGRFTFESCRSEVMARNYLQRLGMESYWDQARAYQSKGEL